MFGLHAQRSVIKIAISKITGWEKGISLNINERGLIYIEIRVGEKTGLQTQFHQWL